MKSTSESKPESVPHDRLLQAFLTEFDYKPGWSFEMNHDWTIHVLFVVVKMLVWDTFAARDLNPIAVTSSYAYPYLNYPDFDTDRTLSWLRRCIHEMETHEADEWIRYKGRQHYNPHGEPQDLGRRPQGWEWMSPPALSIAPHLPLRGSNAPALVDGVVPSV
jgi:hypothetical protein